MQDAGGLLSGDLAASRIRGWRRPEHVIAYAKNTVDLSDLGYVMAKAPDYTATVVVPDDPTVWATAAAFGYDTADPILVAADVLRTATWGDQDEAVAALKSAVLERAEGRPDAAGELHQLAQSWETKPPRLAGVDTKLLVSSIRQYVARPKGR